MNEQGVTVSKGAAADWDAWHDNYHRDTAGAYVELFEMLRVTSYPVLVTARIELFEDSRARTHRMLQQFGVCVPDCALVMRTRGDTATLFKQHVALQLKAAGIHVALAVDDDVRNCNDFHDAGVPTLRAWSHLPEDKRNPTSETPLAAADVPYSAIERLLTDAMNTSVSNGANSVSLPDDYVEIAWWLTHALPPLKAVSQARDVEVRGAEVVYDYGKAGRVVSNGAPTG